MNHLQLKTLLRKRIGSPSLTDVPDANLTEHLNNSVVELMDRYRTPKARDRAKFSTTAGADKYHVDSVADAVLKVWDRTNNRRLEKVGVRTVADTEWDGLAAQIRGKPEKYARFQGYIQLIPIPDGVYVIEFYYHAIPVALVNDGDVPQMPPAWHRGIAIYASYLYYADENKDRAKASSDYNEFSTWASTKRDEIAEEAVDIDSGVELPTLSQGSSKRLDFDHSS